MNVPKGLCEDIYFVQFFLSLLGGVSTLRFLLIFLARWKSADLRAEIPMANYEGRSYF